MVESCTSVRFYITDTFSENGANSFFAWSLVFSSVKKKSLIFAPKGWNDPKLRFFGVLCKFLSVHFTEIYLKWKLKQRLSFLRKPMSKKILVLKLWLKKTLSQSMTETQIIWISSGGKGCSDIPRHAYICAKLEDIARKRGWILT